MWGLRLGLRREAAAGEERLSVFATLHLLLQKTRLYAKEAAYSHSFVYLHISVLY